MTIYDMEQLGYTYTKQAIQAYEWGYDIAGREFSKKALYWYHRIYEIQKRPNPHY
jgi:hypothetical protein